MFLRIRRFAAGWPILRRIKLGVLVQNLSHIERYSLPNRVIIFQCCSCFNHGSTDIRLAWSLSIFFFLIGRSKDVWVDPI